MVGYVVGDSRPLQRITVVGHFELTWETVMQKSLMSTMEIVSDSKIRFCTSKACQMKRDWSTRNGYSACTLEQLMIKSMEPFVERIKQSDPTGQSNFDDGFDRLVETCRHYVGTYFYRDCT